MLHGEHTKESTVGRKWVSIWAMLSYGTTRSGASKMGEVPSELEFSHLAQDTALVWGCLQPDCANSGLFRGHFCVCLGHHVELAVTKGLFHYRKPDGRRISCWFPWSGQFWVSMGFSTIHIVHYHDMVALRRPQLSRLGAPHMPLPNRKFEQKTQQWRPGAAVAN